MILSDNMIILWSQKIFLSLMSVERRWVWPSLRRHGLDYSSVLFQIAATVIDVLAGRRPHFWILRCFSRLRSSNLDEVSSEVWEALDYIKTRKITETFIIDLVVSEGRHFEQRWQSIYGYSGIVSFFLTCAAGSLDCLW